MYQLATQAAVGRHLRVTSNQQGAAVEVCLCEDDYPGWLSLGDWGLLKPATVLYQAKSFSESEIKKLLPERSLLLKKPCNNQTITSGVARSGQILIVLV